MNQRKRRKKSQLPSVSKMSPALPGKACAQKIEIRKNEISSQEKAENTENPEIDQVQDKDQGTRTGSERRREREPGVMEAIRDLLKRGQPGNHHSRTNPEIEIGKKIGRGKEKRIVLLPPPMSTNKRPGRRGQIPSQKKSPRSNPNPQKIPLPTVSLLSASLRMK
jgi:hypothetical protein